MKYPEAYCLFIGIYAIMSTETLLRFCQKVSKRKREKSKEKEKNEEPVPGPIVVLRDDDRNGGRRAHPDRLHHIGHRPYRHDQHHRPARGRALFAEPHERCVPYPDRRGDAQDDHELHHRLGGGRHASCHRASDDRRAYLAAGKPACRAVGRRAVRHSKVPVHLPSGQAARTGKEKERGQAEGRSAARRGAGERGGGRSTPQKRRNAQARRVPHR